MTDLFISKIHIEKVRHLEKIDINIADDEKKHLILTGKNGSGKTSLLKTLISHLDDYKWDAAKEGIVSYYAPIFMEDGEVVFEDHVNVRLNVCNQEVLREWSILVKPPGGGLLLSSHNVLVVYLNAHRKLDIEIPKTIQSVDLEDEETSAASFLNYMVWLNYQKLDALANGNLEESERITKWFNMFKSVLQQIYDCPQLDLIHNSKNLRFTIEIPGKEPFGLNEMADGYSSFLHIVMELIMRMENTASMTYDIPGIVLIDEIEIHLHVDLQRKVLPFLAEMFPRIQFIVTTHSPFVISSLPNAVVYDLERQVRVEDMSGYSYDAIIEYYYDTNQYSLEANKQFIIYQSLVDKEHRTPAEGQMFMDALTYLNMIPASAAPELFLAFHDMEAERKGRHGNGQAE